VTSFPRLIRTASRQKRILNSVRNWSSKGDKSGALLFEIDPSKLSSVFARGGTGLGAGLGIEKAPPSEEEVEPEYAAGVLEITIEQTIFVAQVERSFCNQDNVRPEHQSCSWD
jgi:hypothetical protein